MSNDRSATKPTKIEITPQMIEAGETILLGELGGAVSSYWSAPDLAKRVFQAMIACDRKEPHPIHKGIHHDNPKSKPSDRR